MKLNKNCVVLKTLQKEEDAFVNASPSDRVSFIWELTSEIWSLKEDNNVKRRLQRNVTNLIKK